MFQFTHPGRGATRSCRQFSQTSARFNSRTPGGVRRVMSERRKPVRQVSIHAPREGCDRMEALENEQKQCFNSRTPGGVRPELIQALALTISFNSRTPGGVRLLIY